MYRGGQRRLAPVRSVAVENRNLTRFVHFSPEHVNRETVFETDHLWTEVLCLDRNQTVGPITDHESDAVFTILAGEGVFLVDGKRKRMEQWGTVLVPAKSEVSVTNSSTEPLVLLLIASPPPTPHAVSG